MDDVVKQVVSKYAASSRKGYFESQSPTSMKKKGSGCYHSPLQLYVKPCLDCDTFCNCRYTYFPKYYPDVCVRSVDKQIVQLSGNLVRASGTLSTMVDRYTKGINGASLHEETVVIDREPNSSNSVKKYMTVVTKDGSEEKNVVQVNSPSKDRDYSEGFGGEDADGKITVPFTHIPIRNTARKFHIYKREQQEENCTWEDLIEIDKKKDRLLVLFDQKSSEPTLGITRDTLEKFDYYINMHLDEVDRRVEAKKRSDEFYSQKMRFKSRTLMLLQEEEDAEVNTFQYEDWEEEFFSCDHSTFLDLHKANQELLVWDMYFAIEKWVLLGRGYPRRMRNGWYDIFSDPDFDPTDKRNVFGLYGMPYRNPYRVSARSQNQWHNVPHYRHHATPKWWCINRYRQDLLEDV